MPMMPGKKPEAIRNNINEMVRAGHKPKQAIAAALAHARKTAMSKGGMVGDDDGIDEEHERGLTDLMIQGDQPPVASPETENMQKTLAMHLQEDDEAAEYSMGGLVEGTDGDEDPIVMHDGKEDDYISSKPSDEEHSMIDGVPEVSPSGLSEEAKKALEMKKKMRRFMR